MAKTLLDGVNEVLERKGIIQGDASVLTTLTDSSRQRAINLAIDAWNEGIDKLYSRTHLPKPNELAEDTITLATSDRDYVLAADMNQLYFPLIDETNGYFIEEYKEGYLHLVNSQPYPNNETGLPNYACIRPTDGQLYLDRIPTANENGYVFKYRYDKELVMSAATDTVPFKDVVFRQMVRVVGEIFSRDFSKDFNQQILNSSLATAGRYLIQQQQKSSYLPERTHKNNTDPFED